MKIEISDMPQNPIHYTWKELLFTAKEGIYKCIESENSRFLTVGVAGANRVVLYINKSYMTQADHSWSTYLFTLTNDTLTIKSEV